MAPLLFAFGLTRATLLFGALTAFALYWLQLVSLVTAALLIVAAHFFGRELADAALRRTRWSYRAPAGAIVITGASRGISTL
jgi:hypothetical protein